ncbi:MAG: single-stranded-DNA-specific exonuclease RecJ [Candidatus Pacebacteria bacterium]|nr:single-stranded-DNA-specific exonuclease RecJ [Candidatus Paceibacterota bacterium]MCF7862656.1 single-stranded-DNA-specific exonuclease RecJ [Candidatus Paceibacterota bacterium]
MQLLQKRGISSVEEADLFLNPSYERDFLDPFLMRDMRTVCERILQAIDKDENILIYADYDCDGIPGAVILSDFFQKIGFTNYEVYIPERNIEGYGLNLPAIEGFIKKNVHLLITIDLGITAVEEVDVLQKENIDVIITDHHLPPEVLPKAFAILNPKIDQYPSKMLCGAGVVFKLVQGLITFAEQGDIEAVKDIQKKEKENIEIEKETDRQGEEANTKYPKAIKMIKENVHIGWEKWLLDMAGMATLSDMVPLLGENRAISFFGMKVLRKTPRAGLQKLFSKMKIDFRYLSADDLSFMIIPKINAASRMDSPMRAYELLSSVDIAKASALAEHLIKISDDRKTLVKGIMREVHKIFEKKEITESIREVIVIGNPQWKVGVLGLVAGKLVDQYKRPVFVWGADENDCIRGSCRSPGSVSVVELMSSAKDYFNEFGGHELAGGFSTSREKVPFLEGVLSKTFFEIKKEETKENMRYDLEMKLSEVNMKNWRDLEKLEPFGLGNPKPIFLFKSVIIEKIKKFGKNGGEHLEISFRDTVGNKGVAISFFSSLDSFSVNTLAEGMSVDLLANFDLSRFRGRAELRLRVVDVF